MKPSRLISLIVARAQSQSKRPLMLWGPPGAGKSAVVAAAAVAAFCASKPDDLSDYFIDLRPSQMDQSGADLRFPMIDMKTKEMRWITSEEFPKSGKGILFIDELPQATPAQQAAFSQLILDRRIGTYTLPEGWYVVAAGNRDTDRAATNRMPSHIANRFTHIDFEVDAQDWYDWAYAAGVNPMVIAFLQFKPAWLHKFDAKQRVNPTCRTWQFVSDDLNEECADADLLEVVSGTVGQPAAIEFVGFVRVFRELPDFDTIKKRPEVCKVPDDASVKYAIATMLAALTQPDDMKHVMKYVKRLPSEFQILATQEMTRQNKALAETSSYITWAAENKDLLLNATAR